jgi:hypothetical protein
LRIQKRQAGRQNTTVLQALYPLPNRIARKVERIGQFLQGLRSIALHLLQNSAVMIIIKYKFIQSFEMLSL